MNFELNLFVFVAHRFRNTWNSGGEGRGSVHQYFFLKNRFSTNFFFYSVTLSGNK